MDRRHALGLLSSTAYIASGALRAGAAENVHFASMPIDGGAQVWYAEQLGYFRSAGISADVSSMTNGGAITAGVVGGAIDVGYSNVLSLATAHERGVPVTIIAPAGNYLARAPISALMVPAGSPVKTAKDLNGKIVAVNGLKNITQLATEAWCDQNGGDWKSLHFTEMGFPEMPAALQSHRVDAAFVTEPVVSSAIRRGTATVIGKPYDAISPEFTISVWFTTTAWSKAHPELVRRISTIFRQSSQWANSHDSQSAPMLSTISKIPVTVIDGTTRSRFGETLNPKHLQPIIDIAVRYGLLEKPFPVAEVLDPNALIDTGA